MNTDYHPPLDAIHLALETVGLQELLELPAYANYDLDDIAAVLDGFGQFASKVLAPTDRIGDADGAHLDPTTGRVTLPPTVADAYRRWVADGWSGLAASAEHGGGGLPGIIGTVAEELFASANLALSLNPMLTKGAIHLLEQWGTPEQQATYLPKLVSGAWTGTMNLTESEAGSDVGAVTTRAEPLDGGRWAITGTKIFITWGEHDVADNIVHLVLARTPGSPAGTRGLSLFVVPRNNVEADGTVGVRNAVRCVGLEGKLGIHASPTCVLAFDRAVGELVGPENSGMPAMFTMMNAARLSVGLEGLAVAERAYQQARAFALERRQGRTTTTPAGESAPIIHHPDVRRMLLLIDSGIDAMRLLLYATSIASDLARSHPDSEVRAAAAIRADLLTPLAKAWSTDEGVRLTSQALQVHGGMGYIEESGIAQRFRDARIAPIYEGTNGIQAIDLVNRKVVRDGGAALTGLLDELTADLDRLHDLPGISDVGRLEVGSAVDLARAAIRATRETTDRLLTADDQDRLAAATPYLDLVSLAVCGGLLARQVRHAHDTGHPTADAVTGRFAFYAAERLTAASGLTTAIGAGANRLALANLRSMVVTGT